MNSDDVRTHQARHIQDTLAPTVSYLGRLRVRLEQLRFPPDDRFYLAVRRAHEGLLDLSSELHYLSCKEGVGRPPRE